MPAFSASWPLLFAGQNRVFSGLDHIFVNEGTNVPSPTAQAVQTFLAGLRAAAGPATNVWLMVPFNGAARAELSAGHAAYLSASPDDGRTRLIDLGPAAETYPSGVPVYGTDGYHPTAVGHAALAGLLLAAVLPALAAPAAAYAAPPAAALGALPPIRAAETWEATLAVPAAALDGATRVALTLKASLDDPDAAARLVARVSVPPAAGDGLVRFAGQPAAAAAAGWASISLGAPAAGLVPVTLRLTPQGSDLLAAPAGDVATLHWELGRWAGAGAADKRSPLYGTLTLLRTAWRQASPPPLIGGA